MRRLSTRLLLAAAVAWAGVVAAAPAGLKPVTTHAAAVTVKVTPRTLEGPVWEFEVAFDTHSQELKDDLLRSASLVAADGSAVAPVEWKGAPPGGHHRAGVLRFPALDPQPADIVLKISRPGEAQPRVHRWARPQK